MNEHTFSARIQGELEHAEEKLTADKYLQLLQDLQRMIGERAYDFTIRGGRRWIKKNP